MRRITAAILALVMILGLTGCGGEKKVTQKDIQAEVEKIFYTDNIKWYDLAEDEHVVTAFEVHDISVDTLDAKTESLCKLLEDLGFTANSEKETFLGSTTFTAYMEGGQQRMEITSFEYQTKPCEVQCILETYYADSDDWAVKPN